MGAAAERFKGRGDAPSGLVRSPARRPGGAVASLWAIG